MTLLFPRLRATKNRFTRLAPGDGIKTVVLLLLAVAFWVFLYGISFRALTYFKSIEGLGDLVAMRLLSMVFLTFFSLLLFSNIVTALSTFFLSEELGILLSAPIAVDRIYAAKYVETLIDSSWMPLFYGMPVFIAYGVSFHASPLYYAVLPFAIIPFLMIPCSIGIIVTMLLVHAFPARKAKDFVILLGLLSFVILYILFRVMQPERLVDPDSFPNVIQYLTALRAPMSPLLPSSWITETLASLLRRTTNNVGFNLLMLWSTGLAGFVIGEMLSANMYAAGWSRSQEGKRATLSSSRIANFLFDAYTLPFRGNMAAIIRKDIRVFFRDASQWSQLFLIVALMVVYIYSFKLLPLERAMLPGLYMENMLAYLNIGMVGFVTASVAVRFIFPLVSLEGEAFWLVRTAPISMRDVLLAKFWSSLPPLLLLSEILLVLSNMLLKISPFMMALGVVSSVLLTTGIVALGVGLGAIFPRFRHENVAQIPAGFGGIVYMITAILYIGLFLALEAWPVQRLIYASASGRALSLTTWIWALLSAASVFAISIVVIIVPLRIGLARLSDMQR